MFRRRTLFILGAGASREADLPCGDQLALRISEKLNIQYSFGKYKGGGDGSLFDIFRTKFRSDVNTYLHAASLIRDGIHLADSIDNFLNLHRENDELILLAKATIAKSILEAERESKLWYDDSNAYNSLKFRDLHATWFAKFMKVLSKDVPRSLANTVFDNVSFIVFNYDRRLEHFLHHAVQRLYGFTHQEAASICDEAQIEHPYGVVAPLRIESGHGLKFGERDTNWIELASNIKTFTEQTLDGDQLNSIRTKVQSAECIIFLGFAFHEPNMIMLRPDSPIQPIPIYSTGFGFSDEDSRNLVIELSSMLKDSPRDTIRFGNKLKCADLFDTYSRSLAR
jgi:hypothetical protein